MQMGHVSIFYNDKKEYPCPRCKGPLERSHVQGWFYHCRTCKCEFPLYSLEPQSAETPPTEPRGFFGKMKDKLTGGD